jgi:hypothetical protein
MPHSSEHNVSTVPCQVKLEITKTGLVSTTNLDVMNTLKSVNSTQSTDSSTGARKEHLNKSIVLSVNHLLRPPAAESVPASVRREMFMKSTVKANYVPQTQTPSTINISSNSSSASESVPASVRREMFMKSTVKANCVPQTQTPSTINISNNSSSAKPGPASSKSGSQNTHFSSSNDQPKNIRKNSKKLQLRMMPDPVKQKLIGTPDSCQSSPETPPLVKLQKNQDPSRPTVAQLSSKFETGNMSKTRKN